MIASEKNLMASVDKAYDLYFQLLTLPVELAEYARSRQELARQKRLPTCEDLHPNTRFVDNAVIRLIADSDAVNDRIAARKLSWKGCPELIRTLYTQLCESDYYKEYMQSPVASFDNDRKMLMQFFETIQTCDALDEALEENTRPSHTELKVAAQFKSEEDPAFVRTLFERTLVNYNTYQTYIERFTANWDVERIVFMDNLILATAIAELTSFPSIPVKVTLDEFIEISKYYSTPGSSTFINGILDKAAEVLTAEGLIKKAGRGLL